MYSSIETEEELEQIFNAGMNNGRDKEAKEEANQQDRIDEDENQTNDTSEETVEKKDNKKVYCVICEESSGAHKCSVCDQFVHAICGSYSEGSDGFGLKVTCNLHVRKNRINIEWEGAKSGQEQQAQKMVSLSNSRVPAVDTGTNVVVRVPDLDQGCLAPRNIQAVVDVISSGLYLLGTKEGLLEQLYAHNEFTTADNNFIKAHDVPSSSLSHSFSLNDNVWK